MNFFKMLFVAIIATLLVGCETKMDADRSEAHDTTEATHVLADEKGENTQTGCPLCHEPRSAKPSSAINGAAMWKPDVEEHDAGTWKPSTEIYGAGTQTNTNSSNALSKVIYTNPHTTKVLHSPSVDLKGNVLFGRSRLESDGWSIEETEWILMNYNHDDSENVIPIKGRDAFLASSGENIVFTSDDGLIYLYNMITRVTKPITTSPHTLSDNSVESLVDPLISANLKYIYSRASYYEFYYEDAVLFKLSSSGKYLRQDISGKNILPPDYAYFTNDNKYLVACGESFGSERPTGLLIFDLIKSSIRLNSNKADFLNCFLREEENVVYGLRSNSFETDSSETGSKFTLEKYSIETDNIQEKIDLNEKLKGQVFHLKYPLLAYISESNALKVVNYIEKKHDALGKLEKLSFLAHCPRMVWDLNNQVLIVATDKDLRTYRMPSKEAIHENANED